MRATAEIGNREPTWARIPVSSAWKSADSRRNREEATGAIALHFGFGVGRGQKRRSQANPRRTPPDQPLRDTTSYGYGKDDSISDSTENAAITH
jgi:hypothetical protein